MVVNNICAFLLYFLKKSMCACDGRGGRNRLFDKVKFFLYAFPVLLLQPTLQ